VRTSEKRVFESVDLNEETLQNADVVVLTTNHKDFDVNYIQQHAKLIVDLRNMIEDKSDKVVKL
jgi:UDP-N-acetyl-D-glucosamine dehydrogenase